MRALLESGELIIRGDFRKRISLDQVERVSIEKEDLCLLAAGESVFLALGAHTAEEWAKALTTPPPTLAKKLGITIDSRVYLWGEADDPELAAAVGQSLVQEAATADLWIARVDTEEALDSFLRSKIIGAEIIPILWVIYPKGLQDGIGESIVRRKSLDHGLVDTKVAAVSSRLTALRFNQRRTKPKASS